MSGFALATRIAKANLIVALSKYTLLIIMISGFTLVKDALKQGYPFVEAIASALPICDEFLISEGYSTDGTYEVIQRIASLNKKVKVFRQHWPVAKNRNFIGERAQHPDSEQYHKCGAFIGDLTNAVRKKCKYDYIFHVQAGEVVHEKSTEFIRSIPEICPEAMTFSLPYLHLTNSYVFGQEFRVRFSKNCSHVVAKGDASALGLTRDFRAGEAFKSLINPRRFVQLVGAGLDWKYANNPSAKFSKAIYLPQPIYRYWSLFPRNHIEKSIIHAKVLNLPQFEEAANILKSHIDDPSTFWKLSRLTFRGWGEQNYPETLRFVRKDEHPRIMQDLISDPSNKHDVYYVREEILNELRGF